MNVTQAYQLVCDAVGVDSLTHEQMEQVVSTLSTELNKDRAVGV